MAYFLVMGGLALSLCMLIGWPLWRMLCWLGRRLGVEARPGSLPCEAFRQAPGQGSDERTETVTCDDRESPSIDFPPGHTAFRAWWLTRALAPLGSAWPLAVVAALLYGGTRLAEYGMGARPMMRLLPTIGSSRPGLGHGGLIGMSVLGLVASWRCR